VEKRVESFDNTSDARSGERANDCICEFCESVRWCCSGAQTQAETAEDEGKFGAIPVLWASGIFMIESGTGMNAGDGSLREWDTSCILESGRPSSSA
jgi:hypothetical protein